MSYCVNCGVELAEGEKFCPLCQTEVINPRAPWKDPPARPYPDVMDTLMRRIDRRYLAALISTFMLIPIAVVLITDGLNDGLSWSYYVVGAAALLEIWFILPLVAKRYHRLSFIASDCLATILYMLLIERISGGRWFLPLALPIGLTVTALLLIATYFFRKGRGKELLMRLIIFLVASGILTVVIEVAVDFYVHGAFHLDWSLYVVTPCVILAGALLLIEGKRGLKEEIHKRIFY